MNLRVPQKWRISLLDQRLPGSQESVQGGFLLIQLDRLHWFLPMETLDNY